MKKPGAGPIGQCGTCSAKGLLGGMPRPGAADKITTPLSPVLIPWIDALAHQFAEDYLRSEAAREADSSTERTEPVPLPALDKAA